MSVQANIGAYCEPRNATGPYTEVEIGYPNEREPLLLPYAENPERPTNTIYAWVPKSVVMNVIVRHGGMTSGTLPNGFPYLYAPGLVEEPN
tara:strand:- start:510 stop:782 length:273 start_codon:yes stop_codon:yes gene_type:complete